MEIKKLKNEQLISFDEQMKLSSDLNEYKHHV